MTIDEKALQVAAIALSDCKLFGIHALRKSIEAYESAKQDNLLAMLQSPEVVEVGAMSLAAYAWEYGIADTVQEDVEVYVAENWKRYVGQFLVVLTAITSFIEGDAPDDTAQLPAPDEGGVMTLALTRLTMEETNGN